MKIIPKLSKRVALAALLCVATNAWADAGASLRILNIDAKVIDQNNALLVDLFHGVPETSFWSVYAKDGTSAQASAQPFSIGYSLRDREVLSVSVQYEYTVFDTGQLVPTHPGAFEPNDSSNPCFSTNVTSPFEFGYARIGVVPNNESNCARAPHLSAGHYTSGPGWHQHISGRDSFADSTDAIGFAGAYSYIVASEVFFLPGGTFGADDQMQILLYAQGGPAPVPEPEAWALLVAGLGVVGAVRRNRSSMSSNVPVPKA